MREGFKGVAVGEMGQNGTDLRQGSDILTHYNKYKGDHNYTSDAQT